jgi:hypothetical protein
MAEYINKAELMEQYPEFDGYTFADVTTIDIVHCSECKYWENGTMDLGLDCHTVPDHFCADGEREE